MLCNAEQSAAQKNSSKAVLSMIPDSVRITTKDQQYLLIQADNGEIFFTENAALYNDIVTYLSESIKNADPGAVGLNGSKLDPLSKFYKSQFKLFASSYKKRGMEFKEKNAIYRLMTYKPMKTSDIAEFIEQSPVKETVKKQKAGEKKEEKVDQKKEQSIWDRIKNNP